MDPYTLFTVRSGSSRPYSLSRTTLVFIHISYILTNFSTFLFIPGNTQYCSTRSFIFFIPQYPLRGTLCSSLIAVSYQLGRTKALPLYYRGSSSLNPPVTPYSSYLYSCRSWCLFAQYRNLSYYTQQVRAQSSYIQSRCFNVSSVVVNSGVNSKFSCPL